MSRVTPIPPPVVKRAIHQFVRGISSSARPAHPSPLLDSKSRVSVYLPHALKDLKAECFKRNLKLTGNKSELIERLAAHDIVSSHSYHTNTMNAGTRPVAPSAQGHRIIPLMQGFHTSAPKQAIHDTSTIDYAFLPFLNEESSFDPYANIRVPLLPDNYSPDRSANSPNALETLDGALSGAEISVVAGNPGQVTAALSEVVGNEGLDVDIGQLTSMFSGDTQSKDQGKEDGVLQELWKGVVDDIFGPRGGKTRTA